jgi:uncharacterized integral membrane protein
MAPRGSIQPAASTGRNPSPRAVAGLVLAGVVALFAILNIQTVTVHWIATTSQTPLIVVIAGSGLVGFAAGWLLARRHAARRR